MEHGCVTEAGGPHAHVRTLQGRSEPKVGRKRGGFSLPHQLPAVGVEHPQDQPGLQITMKVYVVTRMRKRMSGKFADLVLNSRWPLLVPLPGSCQVLVSALSNIQLFHVYISPLSLTFRVVFFYVSSCLSYA